MTPQNNPETLPTTESKESAEIDPRSTPGKVAGLVVRGYQQTRELLRRLAQLTGKKLELPADEQLARSLEEPVAAPEISGYFFEQRVLPETIEQMAEASAQYIRPAHKEKLTEHQWIAYERRESIEVPDINFYLSAEGNTAAESKKAAEHVERRAKTVADFLGYTRDEIESFSVVIDPTDIPYKNASAFYENRDVWIKLADKGLSVDHELAHVISLGALKPQPRIMPQIALEGMAGWVAWQAKSPEEKAKFPEENYIEQNRKVWAPTIKPEDMSLDMPIHPEVARCLGATLFEVVNEELGGDPKRIGAEWKKFTENENMSEWVAATGLDPKNIEEKWKAKIFSATNT